MKIRITLKDPDGVYYSVKDACTDSALEAEQEFGTIDVNEVLNHASIRTWIKWSEYITIEIDTATETATVIPVVAGPK